MRNLFLRYQRSHACEAKSETMRKNVKWILSTLALVNFNDKLILSGWNWMMQFVGMKNIEESKSDQEKNWLWERKHFEIPVSETSVKWKNWGEFRKCELTNSLYQNSEKVMHNTGAHFTDTGFTKKGRIVGIIRENVRIKNRFAEENYLSQSAVVPSPRSMLSRDRSMRLDTWNLSGAQGNVFGNTRHMLDSSQMSYQRILHSTNQSATGGIPVERSTWRPVAGVKNELEAQFKCLCLQGGRQPWILPTSENSTEFYGWSAKTAKIGASVWQNSHTLNVFMLEDKIPNPGKLMFRFSLGSYVTDQRSGDDRFFGWAKIIALNLG